MFIDTHTHLYTEEFDEDREEVVARAREAGACGLFLPNIDEASIEPMMKMVASYPDLCRPMIGLHPTELPDNPTRLLDKMEAMAFAKESPFIAIGEVGIDLYWDKSRKEEQIAVFKRQAEWADALQMPLMVHSRKAHRDIVNTLLPFAERLTGVFHCFSGSMEEARELLTRFPGFSLGIGGVLTFKNANLPATLKAAVPLDRIVLETDAPYLAPTPHRGKRNEPTFVPLVIARLAEIYQLTIEETETVILEHTKKLFPKWDKLRDEAQIT